MPLSLEERFFLSKEVYSHGGKYSKEVLKVDIRCEELHQVFSSLHRRVKLCLQEDGSHFQQLLLLVNVANIHRICLCIWYIFCILVLCHVIFDE